MTIMKQKPREAPLFSYAVASSDMRYIEINTREIVLRNDPRLGQVIRGEIPECQPSCHVDLSYILLEYAMGCEDCREPAMTAEAAEQFGRRLGKLLLNALDDEASAAGAGRLQATMNIILHSLSAPFELEETAAQLRYRLPFCPLHDTAQRTGFNLEIPMAHLSFVSLCEQIVQSVAPGWQLTAPVERAGNTPLLEIAFNHS